jgi:KDO2-lipid IV(A) lauroyltransferase
LSKSAVIKRLEYAVYRLFAGRVRAADDARIDRWGARVARAARLLLASRHRMAVRNIALTFPEKSLEECERIAEQSWRHFATMFLRSIRAHGESVEDLYSRIPIGPPPNFYRARAENRGVILVSAHFGSWEIGSNLLPLSEMKITTVARFLENELLNEELLRGRRREGVEIVDRRDAARALVYALMRKGMVVLLADQHVRPVEGIRLPFLGREAWSSTTPARLALRFGSPILLAFAYPDRVDLEEPIIPGQLPADERSVEALTLRINNTISERIRRNPELWFWMHNRWKNG